MKKLKPSIPDRRELLAESNPDMLFADGYDAALIGFVEIASNTVAVYDKNKIIQMLVEEGMSEEEALEHFYYNIVGAYVGENTPAFLTKLSDLY